MCIVLEENCKQFLDVCLKFNNFSEFKWLIRNEFHFFYDTIDWIVVATFT